MGQIAERSLEARIIDLEAFARSLQAGNITDLASVVDASGAYLPLSSLAFGQVTSRDVGQVSLETNVATWFVGTPQLDVFVQGGRLRVDVAGWLIVGGLNLRLSMSYQVAGPTEEAGPGGAVVVAPGEERALMLTSKGNAASYEMAAGFPDLVEDLDPGWYRVNAAYQLVGEVNAAVDTFGYVINRRVFATPL